MQVHPGNRPAPVAAAAVMVFATSLILCWLPVAANSAEAPRYKPSSGSPAPLDITSNNYGFSRTAPEALAIGDTAPEFSLPQAGGGSVELGAVRQQGPTVIIFYRGHW